MPATAYCINGHGVFILGVDTLFFVQLCLYFPPSKFIYCTLVFLYCSHKASKTTLARLSSTHSADAGKRRKLNTIKIGADLPDYHCMVVLSILIIGSLLFLSLFSPMKLHNPGVIRPYESEGNQI